MSLVTVEIMELFKQVIVDLKGPAVVVGHDIDKIQWGRVVYCKSLDS